jgi:hypothetical protein
MADRQTTLTGEIAQHPYEDERLLRRLYQDDDASLADIATACECSRTTVWRYLRAFGITNAASTPPNERPVTPASFCTRTDGYEAWSDECYYVLVHRLLAVAEWGFAAVANSVVHHENTHRWDNRAANLRLFPSQSAHTRHHARPVVTDDQQTLDKPAPTRAASSADTREQRSRQTSLTDFAEPERAESDA